MASLVPPPTAADVPPWPPRAAAALLALTLVAVALRLAGLSAWAYEDGEARGWLWLAQPCELAAAPQPLAPLGWLALHALADAGLLPLRGEGWLRLPAALAGACAVPALALAVRPHGGIAVALVAAALLAAHPAALAASQALDPAMFAAVLGVSAAVALRRQRRVVAVALALLAAATSPGAVGLPIALALLASPAGQHRRLAAALGGLGFAAALFGLGPSLLPLVAFAAVGWPVAARPLRLLVGAVVLGAVVARHTGGGEFAAAVAVPALAALAARGLVDVGRAIRGGLAAPAPLAAVAAAVPTAVVFAWLAVDAFLYAGVHRGARSPWRAAADAVWDAGGAGGAFVVAAGVGQPSLQVYLRPHAGGGVAVVPFAPAGGVAEVQAAAARPEPHVLLALREDELHRLSTPARAALATSFQCVRVVPSPQLHGDDTVTVYRRRSAADAAAREPR